MRGAHRLYDRLGFERRADRDWLIDDPPLHLFGFWRALTFVAAALGCQSSRAGRSPRKPRTRLIAPPSSNSATSVPLRATVPAVSTSSHP